MIFKTIPITKIILLLLPAMTILSLAQPAHVSAANNKQKTPQHSGAGAAAFDDCSAALLKSGHDTLTCTKVTESGNCGSGKVFNPDKQCLTTLPKVVADTSTVKKGLQIVFGVAAGVAMISLGIAAFNFATAATDAEKISRSKKAIVFALLGLAIALLAEAIVTTVIGKL